MRLFVQERGSGFDAKEYDVCGPLKAVDMYKYDGYFSGSKDFVIFVWFDEFVDNDEFIRHFFYFNKHGLFNPQDGKPISTLASDDYDNYDPNKKGVFRNHFKITAMADHKGEIKNE